MQVQFIATLTKVTTKRAKRDAQGIVTEEPAIAITVDVPMSVIKEGSLGSLLRATDQEVRVLIATDQRSFDVSPDGRELVTNGL